MTAQMRRLCEVALLRAQNVDRIIYVVWVPGDLECFQVFQTVLHKPKEISGMVLINV